MFRKGQGGCCLLTSQHNLLVNSGYTGIVKVLLRYGGMGSPEGDAPFLKIKRGDRIAQMVIQRVPYVVLKLVDELGKTDRGDNGFGSSGVS